MKNRAKGAAGVKAFPQFCEAEYKTEFLNYPPLADWGGIKKLNSI